MKLNDKLNNLKSYPFHMPGHKRNEKFNITGAQIDITEIDGFDNLHNPKECLLDIENRYTKLYNSKKSILSVNGSTCGILSAISAVCNKGDKIIIARNCHKSVYNACFINELKVQYILPDIVDEFNCFDKITQKQIDDAVKNNPDAKAVVITSPTYEGIVSDINSPVPLIIDCAHGAHFGFDNNFPKYPNADIVISSLHKTLPALTQSAIVNIYNKKYIPAVKKYMDIFETSSPSYVIMSSIEKCADFIDNNNFDEFFNHILELRNEIKKLKAIELLDNDDLSRICIKSSSLNGNQLADILRAEYKIEAEMSCKDYVILICTVADDKNAFDTLLDALKEIDTKYNNLQICSETASYTLPSKAKESFEITDTLAVDFDKSENYVCAEYIFAYPPGIPIIVPGEIIDSNVIAMIKTAINSNTNIISDSGLLPHKILTNGKV